MEENNKFKKAYMQLNETQKKTLRDNFNEEFEYGNSAFWRKVNNPNQFWNTEKKFIAKAMDKTLNELFEL